MPKRDFTKKQREQEEATAQAFEEFVQSFQTDVVPHKTFVKSTVINARPGEEIGDQVGSIYKPKGLLKKQAVTTLKDAIECAQIIKKGKWDKNTKDSGRFFTFILNFLLNYQRLQILTFMYCCNYR